MVYQAAVPTREPLKRFNAANPNSDAIPEASTAAITPPAETALVDKP